MNGLDVSVVIDLGGFTRPNAVSLRDELLGKLSDPSTSSYEFTYGKVRFRPIAGTLVKVIRDWTHGGDEDWRAFAGLKVSFVQITEDGNDHFPAAGIYHAKRADNREIAGASATVRWSLDHEYPLREETIESVVRGSRSDFYTETLRLVVPVVYSRKWSLNLTAPTLKKAFRAHEMLRGGEWPVTIPFVDTTEDVQKLRLLQQAVDTED